MGADTDEISSRASIIKLSFQLLSRTVFKSFRSKKGQLSRSVWLSGTLTLLPAAGYLGLHCKLPKTPIRSGVSQTLTLGMVVTREFFKKVTRQLFAGPNLRNLAAGMENSQVIHRCE